MNKLSLLCISVMSVFLMYPEQGNITQKKDRELFADTLIKTMLYLPQCCNTDLTIEECQKESGIATDLNPQVCSMRVHALEYYSKFPCNNDDDSNKKLCNYIKKMESSMRNKCKAIS